jgi:hypothetical protein
MKLWIVALCLLVVCTGGHAFGLRPSSNPIARWPSLAETWMSTIGMLPAATR